jgi:signal transduction histidine kinase
VDKKHVRVSAGSGIGLAIVRQILDLHQFQYGVSSEVGKGSTFWFEMPTVVPAPQETGSEPTKAA